ncbi:MAG: hypothetical protein J2P36_18065 [Ktedonobacteraceae bacterium]|nr:hypothetical protein [Ktedonobacteraceae bacterium]
MFSTQLQPGAWKRLAIISGVVIGIILIISFGISTFLSLNPPTQNKTAGKPATTTTTPSPLIFGSNIDLLGNKNQKLPSDTAQHTLQSLHLQIIRVPVPVNASDASVKQAAQFVKDMEATMLVSLRGVMGTNSQRDAMRVVKDISQVFGQNIFYIEFGNEEDLQGTPVDQYLSAWNTIVPTLKQQAPKALFVGPVTYHYDPKYLRSFLQQARPLPDAVSWHEYTCDAKQTSDQCKANLQDWSKHFDDARQAMTDQLKTILPVMITEWNYAANADPSDGKSNNEDFMTTWTAQALQILQTNSVFASMQFSAINSPAPLVDNQDTLTPQGSTLQEAYNQYIASNPPPGPTGTAVDTPTATATTIADAPTPTPTPNETPGTDPLPGKTPTVSIPPTIAPTKAPTKPPAPTPTPTPHPCASHNWYLHPYGGTTGSTHLTTTSYCHGKILLTLTKTPAYMTEMRVCIVNGSCGSWVRYAGVNKWLTMYTGLKAGKVFYLQARDVNGKGSYVIYGTVKY